MTLRLALVVPVQLQLDFMPMYRVTSWASWIVNLLLAELWLRLTAVPPAQLVATAASQGANGGATRSHTSNGRAIVRDRTGRPE